MQKKNNTGLLSRIKIAILIIYLIFAYIPTQSLYISRARKILSRKENNIKRLFSRKHNMSYKGSHLYYIYSITHTITHHI